MQLKKTVLFKKIPGTGKNLRIFWYYIQNQKLTAGKHSKSEKSSDLLYNFFEILMVGLRPTSNFQLVTEKSLVVTLIADSGVRPVVDHPVMFRPCPVIQGKFRN